MKNPIFLCVLLCCLLSNAGIAQRANRPYLNVNAGIGLLPTFLKDGGKSEVMPMVLSADYKFGNSISLGLSAGYSVTRSGLRELPSGDLVQWRNRFTAVALRAAAHSRMLYGCWNIYGGLKVGYADSDIEMMEGDLGKARQEMGLGRTNGDLLFTGFIGSRWNIASRWGVFGEIGLGVSLLTIGTSVRL